MEIKELVANKIAQSGTTVANMITDMLVNKEIEKRSQSIIASLVVLEKLEKDLTSISKPDVNELLDVEGKVVQPAAYSKSKLEQIKKAKEKVENLTKAINTCLETNTKDSYSKLENLIKNAGGNTEKSSGDNS
jgi:hypothetical protein